MVVSYDIELPTEEELTVPEVNVSSSLLRAASFHLGKYCENANNEFMLCRSEYLDDPRKCLAEGKVVTSCSLEFFRKLKQACRPEFEQYADCVDKSSAIFKLAPCRSVQKAYDECMVDKMGLHRPPFGYFCEVKIHDTKRPKPVPPVQHYPDAAVNLPADYPRYPPKAGDRKVYL